MVHSIGMCFTGCRSFVINKLLQTFFNHFFSRILNSSINDIFEKHNFVYGIRRVRITENYISEENEDKEQGAYTTTFMYIYFIIQGEKCDDVPFK